MITDTNGDLFPQGTYQFTVSEIPFEVDVKGYQAWQWTFEAITDEGTRTYSERFMVWLLAPLFRGLGFKETTPGRFDWEPTEALDRTFTATIKHVTLDKGASAGKTVARMSEIVPKGGGMPAIVKAAVMAQAPATQDDIPF